MTKNDYIEKITQNLEHLTKDELKDVATLTNAQFGVRLKVAEKEYWGKEIANLKSQLQQQALPVVPEYVVEFIDDAKGNLSLYGALSSISDNKNNELNNWVFREAHQNLFARAWLDGYTIEKPQLFYLKSKSLLENEGESEEPDVDELYLNAKGNLVIYKGDAKKFTQSEIDSMQTGSYEQIEVEE